MKKYGIYDHQKREFRYEIYDSRNKAISEFREYWTDIAYSDWFDNFDFETYKKQHNIPFENSLTMKEKEKIVIDDLNSFSNEEFFDFFEFEVKPIIVESDE